MAAAAAAAGTVDGAISLTGGVAQAVKKVAQYGEERDALLEVVLRVSGWLKLERQAVHENPTTRAAVEPVLQRLNDTYKDVQALVDELAAPKSKGEAAWSEFKQRAGAFFKSLTGFPNALEALQARLEEHFTELSWVGRGGASGMAMTQEMVGEVKDSVAVVSSKVDKLGEKMEQLELQDHDEKEIDFDGFNVPDLDLDRVVGRQQELDELCEMLSGGNGRVQAVAHGMGGVGKTYLLLMLAHRMWASEEHAAVWVPSETREEAVGALLALLGALGGEFADAAALFDRTDESKQLAAQAALLSALSAKLSRCRKRVVFFFDNVPRWDDVAEFVRLLARPRDWVVVSSRSALKWQSGSLFEVGVFDEATAAQLLWCRARGIAAADYDVERVPAEELAWCHEIHRRVGGLPLALAVVAESGYESMGECAARLKEILGEEDLADTVDNYRLRVHAALQLQIKGGDGAVKLEEDAWRVLLACAMTRTPDDIKEEDVKRVKMKRAYGKALRTLVGRNLVRRSKEGVLAIHRLMQEAVLRTADECGAGEAAGEVALALDGRPAVLCARRPCLCGLQWLVREGGADTTVQSITGQTLLHWAAMCGHLEVVQWLVREGGADATVQDNHGRTPLYWAAQCGHLEMVQWMVREGGADATVRDMFGRTPLCWAIGGGHLAVAQWLVREGGDDATLQNNVGGDTPLHSAARNGHLEVVQWLVSECGADATVQDSEGRTALHWAVMGGDLEVVQWLVCEHGADAMVQDARGHTPLQLATMHRRLKVSQFLKSLQH